MGDTLLPKMMLWKEGGAEIGIGSTDVPQSEASAPRTMIPTMDQWPREWEGKGMSCKHPRIVEEVATYEP